MKMLFDFIFKRRKNRKREFKYDFLIEVSSMSDIPKDNLGRSIYIVGNNNHFKWVVFDCPGEHKKRIEVNLMKNRKPNWLYEINNNKISLSPSVAVDSTDCDCHFWLKNNIAYKAYYTWEKNK